MELSVATIGGILLCLGAMCTVKGNVYAAVATYIFADIAWIWLAYDNADYQGMCFTIFGTLLGIAAFIKMQFGFMQKDLKNKD